MTNFATMDSDFGTVVLLSRNGRLSRLDLVSTSKIEIDRSIRTEFPEAIESDTPFKHVMHLLNRYFKGEEVHFDIPLELTELQAFTRQVLTETRKIPYGRFVHYGLIGRNLGYPNAARAVGQALKRNPIPIVVPCHRVLRSDGSLGGFDMGLEMKVRLLSLEGVPVRKLRDSTRSS